jgi:exonuclease SbcD
MKILHFADAHIGVTNQGLRDPQTDLPVRVMDYLKSLDTIVDASVREKVDLVLFCGDAFHHRQPSTTHQREWGKRIMRLSRAGIHTVLLVGNHDLSPAMNRAHSLDAFQTFGVPHVTVVDKPSFLTSEMLGGIDLQIIAFPYITRSSFSDVVPGSSYYPVIKRISQFIQQLLDNSNSGLPTILASHMLVEGASYGGYRTVTLNSDMAVPMQVLCDPRISYVALGHLHKPQSLNEGAQPPVVYPGSIERVDFGEYAESKFYVIAEVNKGEDTKVTWYKLDTRPFIDCKVTLERTDAKEALNILSGELPLEEEMKDAMVRLVITYPRDIGAAIDEVALRKMASSAFEFRIVRKPINESSVRLSENTVAAGLSPFELLKSYFGGYTEKELADLLDLGSSVMADDINKLPSDTE